MTKDRPVESNGVSLLVREWPGERPLLMIHGLASSSHIFDLVAPMLAPQFRVVAYDQRGHGRSGKPASGYGFGKTSADAGAVAKAMRMRRPIVLGHSWGANVALELAVAHPGAVDGLVLLDGGFRSLSEDMNWKQTKQRLAPPEMRGLHVDEFRRMLGNFTGGKVRMTPEMEGVFLSLMRVDGEGRIRPRLSRANHMRILRALWEQDTESLLGRLRTPALLILARSGDPEQAGFEAAKAASVSRIRSLEANVRVRWIESLHDLPLHKPRALASRIRKFVAEIDG